MVTDLGGAVLSSTLIDTRVELQSNAEQAACGRCTQEALLLQLAELAKRTLCGGLRPIGWLDILTPRAEISVDGSLHGQTPFRHAMFLRTQRVTVFRPYCERVIADLKVEQEETTFFAPALVPLPLSRGEQTARIGRWAFGSVGLTMVAIGAGLLRREDTYPEPAHSAEFSTQVSTHIPGIALLAGGRAALDISVTLFVADAYYIKRRR